MFLELTVLPLEGLRVGLRSASVELALGPAAATDEALGALAVALCVAC